MNKSNELNISELPHANGYGISLVELCPNVSERYSLVPLIPLSGRHNNSVGKNNGSVFGCNANNSNASVRYANCNNHAANANSNYAGAFAINKDIEKHLTTHSPRVNINDNHAANGAHGQYEYESIPYYGDDIAESNATAPFKDADIFKKLKIANSKRKLKNLTRFFLNREIISAGFDRCIKNASKTKEVSWYISHKEETLDRILKEFKEHSYRPKPCVHRLITKRNKGDKDREAEIFCVYDRIIHSVILIVIEEKFRNKMIRNIYSGIKGRSLLSNDKKYCMINKIRFYLKNHPKEYTVMTDIRHFYKSLTMKIALGVMFKTIVCPFTRDLLLSTFKLVDNIPIGGSLSQMMAMVTLEECDREILRLYHPTLLCCFGDNRFIGGSKKNIQKILHFENSYYAGRFNLKVKNDYSLHKNTDSMRFCKYDYFGSFVHVRSAIKRRAIKAYGIGMQHYAGYRGMLMKTDSKRLIYLIEKEYKELRMKNKKGMNVPDMKGTRSKLGNFENEEIWITAYRRINNDKESGYYLRIQFIHIDSNGSKMLYVAPDGCEEIKEFFELVKHSAVEIPKKVTVKREGNKVYFEGFHTSNKEACEILCNQLNI